jgi:hypothetical protein
MFPRPMNPTADEGLGEAETIISFKEKLERG